MGTNYYYFFEPSQHSMHNAMHFHDDNIYKVREEESFEESLRRREESWLINKPTEDDRAVHHESCSCERNYFALTRISINQSHHLPMMLKRSNNNISGNTSSEAQKEVVTTTS